MKRPGSVSTFSRGAVGAVGAAVVGALLLAGCTASKPPSPATSPSAGASSTAGGSATGCRLPQPKVKAQPDSASLARATAVMTTYAARAWNPSAPAARPSTLTGGLYINYRWQWDGSSDVLANTNIRTDGDSDDDAGTATRHDPLTDIVVLRDIDALLSAGVRNGELDQLRCRLQPVTEAEFVNYGPSRGWIFQQLVDLANLDPQGPWLDSARRFAATLAKRYANGLPADTSFRPDWIAESAAALADAGIKFSQPGWVVIARNLDLQLVKLSANATTGLFPGELKLDGAGKVAVSDVLVKVGSQAQLIDALLDVAKATSDPVLLAAGKRALDSLISPAIGVIDAVRGGWFYAVDADGKNVRTSYKETRQAWLVSLFTDAAAAGLISSDYTAKMTVVVRDRLYQAQPRGYVYRVAAAWTPFITSGDGKNTQEDWISSEATGIAIQALLGSLT